MRRKSLYSIAFALTYHASSAQVSTQQLQAQLIMKSASVNNHPEFVNDNSSGQISQPSLFKEVDPTGYDLLAANISFSEKNQIQKVGIAPFRLIQRRFNWYSNAKINLTNNSGALTSGFSLGTDNSVLYSERVQMLFKDFQNSVAALPDLPSRGGNETIVEYEARPDVRVYRQQLETLIDEFERRRMMNVIKISGGYNAQFFPVLKSESDDTNFDSLNYHGFKAHNFFANVSYSYNNGSVVVSATYNYFSKRKSADSIQERRTYHGLSIGISKRIIRLISDAQLKTKEFYVKTLFIPSIYLGASYEFLGYGGAEPIFAEENAKNTRVFTPYLDVAITPSLQFRLAFPIKRVDQYLAKSDAQLIGGLLQFNYKIINLE